ncbi:MAG: YceI family protein [Spirochaetaceae bacterium]|nr:MAG: YceI family protein [Spirochaetaceae bacterium]
MKAKSVFKVAGIAVAVLAVAFAAFSAYIWFSGGSSEPSAPAEARRTEPRDEQSILYEVVAGESVAQFLIGEVLRGRQNTVVGSTDQIDGSLALGLGGTVEIGEFVINLRNIRTDDEMRDRTIRTMILETNRDEFEFSTFVPTAVAGVPSSFGVGDTLELMVTGDLTVRDVTAQVTFDMTLRIQTEDRIEGTASTVILWDDFDITIPYVGGNSFVASVEDQVELRMEFVAAARR